MALEFTPISALVENGALPFLSGIAVKVPLQFRPNLKPELRKTEWIKVEARAPLAKAHSFERLRLVYADIYDRATKI